MECEKPTSPSSENNEKSLSSESAFPRTLPATRPKRPLYSNKHNALITQSPSQTDLTVTLAQRGLSIDGRQSLSKSHVNTLVQSNPPRPLSRLTSIPPIHFSQSSSFSSSSIPCDPSIRREDLRQSPFPERSLIPSSSDTATKIVNKDSKQRNEIQDRYSTSNSRSNVIQPHPIRLPTSTSTAVLQLQRNNDINRSNSKVLEQQKHQRFSLCPEQENNRLYDNIFVSSSSRVSLQLEQQNHQLQYQQRNSLHSQSARSIPMQTNSFNTRRTIDSNTMSQSLAASTGHLLSSATTVNDSSNMKSKNNTNHNNENNSINNRNNNNSITTHDNEDDSLKAVVPSSPTTTNPSSQSTIASPSSLSAVPIADASLSPGTKALHMTSRRGWNLRSSRNVSSLPQVESVSPSSSVRRQGMLARMAMSAVAASKTRKAGVYNIAASIPAVLHVLHEQLRTHYAGVLTGRKEHELRMLLLISRGGRRATIGICGVVEDRESYTRLWVRRTSAESAYKVTQEEFDWFCSELNDRLSENVDIVRPFFV